MLLGNEMVHRRANQDFASAARDKEISIKQIVDEERKIIESRFKKDLDRLRQENKDQI